MKHIIKRMARLFGLEIKRYIPESSETARLMKLFSYHQISTVLDVGANKGQYAQLLRENGYRGRIISFEPLTSTHALLLEASRRDPSWTVAPRAALGDRDGDITINIAQNTVSSSILPMHDTHLRSEPKSAYIATESAPVCKLDTIASDYLRQEDTSVFLKIDVQGYESQVLAGASRTLPGIKGIQLELSLVPLYEGEPLFQEMLNLLDKLGYELNAVIPGFTEKQSGRLLQMDGIFFRT
jgi:FkbM family methyltransferase